MEEVTAVILDYQKFKKTSGENEGEAFVANLSGNRSHS